LKKLYGKNFCLKNFTKKLAERGTK